MLLLNFIKFLILGSIALLPGTGNEPDGYRVVVPYREGFIAAGTGGRIDWIAASGKITRSEEFPGETFNCVLVREQNVMAAGANGMVLVSDADGDMHRIDSGTRRNIHSLALFKGKVLAGTDGGILVAGEWKGSFRILPLALKGRVVSLSVSPVECFGATDAGEIIRSSNGSSWDVLDFNALYAGYYKPCTFKKILATDKQIVLAGVQDDGYAVFYYSSMGGVWTGRPLYYTDDKGSTAYLAEAPNDIFYDAKQAQFLLACDSGKLMMLPSCSQCNELAVLSGEDLISISGNGVTLVVAGSKFFLGHYDVANYQTNQ